MISLWGSLVKPQCTASKGLLLRSALSRLTLVISRPNALAVGMKLCRAWTCNSAIGGMHRGQDRLLSATLALKASANWCKEGRVPPGKWSQGKSDAMSA